MKHKIEIEHYSYDCGDGCCTNSGTIVKVDGKEGKFHNDDTETVLAQVLDLLGIDYDYEEKYTDE